MEEPGGSCCEGVILLFCLQIDALPRQAVQNAPQNDRVARLLCVRPTRGWKQDESEQQAAESRLESFSELPRLGIRLRLQRPTALRHYAPSHLPTTVIAIGRSPLSPWTLS